MGSALKWCERLSDLLQTNILILNDACKYLERSHIQRNGAFQIFKRVNLNYFELNTLLNQSIKSAEALAKNPLAKNDELKHLVERKPITPPSSSSSQSSPNKKFRKKEK